MTTNDAGGPATHTTPPNGKRRRLGKGLSGLIGEPVPVEPRPESNPDRQPSQQPSQHPDPRPRTENRPAATDQPGDQQHAATAAEQAHIPSESPQTNQLSDVDAVVQLPVEAIIPNRFQPRERFDDERLGELARSIARDGVMQPILVRPGSAGGSTGGRYELIAGERRWRAAKLAGLARVPAIVRTLEDRDASAWALIENVHRQDLGPIEKADAIAGMIARDGLTQAEAAERLLLERSTVANLVRLVGLEPAIRELLNTGRLSTGHGKALAGVPAGDGRIALAEQAAAGGWSVRKLEQAAAGSRPSAGASPAPGGSDRRDAVLGSMEKRLGEALNTRVRIRSNKAGTKGAISIDFYGHDHFEGLLERLGVRDDT